MRGRHQRHEFEGGGRYTPPEPGREPGGMSGHGAGPESGGASEAFFTKEAAEIAKGLELPCPKDDENTYEYGKRMPQYCEDKVKAAFPWWSKFWPPLAETACTTAGIKERATSIMLGILSCVKPEQ